MKGTAGFETFSSMWTFFLIFLGLSLAAFSGRLKAVSVIRRVLRDVGGAQTLAFSSSHPGVSPLMRCNHVISLVQRVINAADLPSLLSVRPLAGGDGR